MMNLRLEIVKLFDLIKCVKLIVNFIRWLLFNEFIGLLINIYCNWLNWFVLWLVFLGIFKMLIICLSNE